MLAASASMVRRGSLREAHRARWLTRTPTQPAGCSTSRSVPTSSLRAKYVWPRQMSCEPCPSATTVRRAAAMRRTGLRVPRARESLSSSVRSADYGRPLDNERRPVSVATVRTKHTRTRAPAAGGLGQGARRIRLRLWDGLPVSALSGCGGSSNREQAGAAHDGPVRRRQQPWRPNTNCAQDTGPARSGTTVAEAGRRRCPQGWSGCARHWSRRRRHGPCVGGTEV